MRTPPLGSLSPMGGILTGLRRGFFSKLSSSVGPSGLRYRVLFCEGITLKATPPASVEEKIRLGGVILTLCGVFGGFGAISES